MKDELEEKVMIKFVEEQKLSANIYSYSTDDDSEDKKWKCTNKCVIKRKVNFENYKTCLEATRFENKLIFLEKS